MDRRFFLALALTIGVILLTPKLFPGAPVPVAPIAADPAAPRIARIRNTLALDRVVLSEACLPALAGRPEVEVLVQPTAWRFDGAGNFDQATDLLEEVASAG